MCRPEQMRARREGDVVKRASGDEECARDVRRPHSLQQNYMKRERIVDGEQDVKVGRVVFTARVPDLFCGYGVVQSSLRRAVRTLHGEPVAFGGGQVGISILGSVMTAVVRFRIFSNGSVGSLNSIELVPDLFGLALAEGAGYA